MATFVLMEIAGSFYTQNLILLLAISFLSAYFVFSKLKTWAVGNCVANLCDTSINFEFDSNTKTLPFAALTSYKVHQGRNGSAFYLNTTQEKFRISVNKNFCSSSGFNLFCQAALASINDFKKKKPIP
jgi:hypothetical protein